MEIIHGNQWIGLVAGRRTANQPDLRPRPWGHGYGEFPQSKSRKHPVTKKDDLVVRLSSNLNIIKCVAAQDFWKTVICRQNIPHQNFPSSISSHEIPKISMEIYLILPLELASSQRSQMVPATRDLRPSIIPKLSISDIILILPFFHFWMIGFDTLGSILASSIKNPMKF